MVENSTYSKVALNQTMRRHKPDNQYGDFVTLNIGNPQKKQKNLFSYSNKIETNCSLDGTNILYEEINLISLFSVIFVTTSTTLCP